MVDVIKVRGSDIVMSPTEYVSNTWQVSRGTTVWSKQRRQHADPGGYLLFSGFPVSLLSFQRSRRGARGLLGRLTELGHLLQCFC